MSLLERDEQVRAVLDRFAGLDRSGHLFILSGEAGAGKTALVQELVDHHLGQARVLVGRCDDLFASRPLGPFVDMARDRPGPLADALTSEDQGVMFDAFLTEVSAESTVVVLDDLQWADEASLDLLRYAARRLDQLPCLILATHRDGLAADHPMRLATGSLVGPLVTRLRVPPLSVDAVRTMIGDRNDDPADIHAHTGGNPFFVIETLAAAPGTVPASVLDLIAARVATLGDAARDALDAAAVLGRRVGAELIQAVGECDTAAIDECLTAGLLVDDDGQEDFRHDLTRQAVDELMTPLRRRQLHARALAVLGDRLDLVERAHHAIGAGDDDAIVDLAWRAADRCVALGAWHQAADLYARTLEHGNALDVDRRCRLLEAQATACLRVDRGDEALAAGEERLALVAASGDLQALGEWGCRLAAIYTFFGRSTDAMGAAREGIDRLEPFGTSPALARGLATLAHSLSNLGLNAECMTVAQRALEMAEALGIEETAVSSLNSYGCALFDSGEPTAGTDAVRTALDRAKRAGLANEVVRAAGNLAVLLLSRGQPALALPVLEDAIAHASEHELLARRNFLYPGRAEVKAILGDWDAATVELTALLDERVGVVTRVMTMQVLGRIRSRRGEPGAAELLEGSLDLLGPDAEPQGIAPARLGLAELAWLAGDEPRAREHVEALLPLADLVEPLLRRELTLWARRTGVPWAADGSVDEPTRYVVAGDHRSLARFWDERGCPYEAADALADSDDVDDVRRAYDMLRELRAQPRMQMVARRLRELGVRDLPQGPRASTRANAAGLTAREVEVAALVVAGLTNAEIADRLVVSQKTVNHHVSAVLSKLAVSTRRQVGRAAAERGLVLEVIEVDAAKP